MVGRITNNNTSPRSSVTSGGVTKTKEDVKINVELESAAAVQEAVDAIMAAVNNIEFYTEDARCIITCVDLLGLFGNKQTDRDTEMVQLLKEAKLDHADCNIMTMNIKVRQFIIALLATKIPEELLQTATAGGQTFWQTMCRCVLGTHAKVPTTDTIRRASGVDHFRKWLKDTLLFVPYCLPRDLDVLTNRFRIMCETINHPSYAYKLGFINALKAFANRIASIRGIRVPEGHWDYELDAMLEEGVAQARDRVADKLRRDTQ